MLGNLKFKDKVFLLVALALVTGCGSKEIYKRTELAMGTIVEISVADEDKTSEEIEEAVNKAFEAIKQVEKLMSSYREDSDVSRLNRLSEGKTIAVSDETLEVIKKSIEFSELSEGSFDITISPILQLWGFGKGSKKRIPTRDEIDERLPLVNFHNIIIDEAKKTVGFAHPGMKIDLGGIAKGYAVDKAVETLRREGIKGAMVNAGGDIYCLGTKAKGEPWTIGVKQPRKPSQVLTTLKVKDRAVATSGDYESFFIIGNKRYSHLIDPRNGHPAPNGVMSVTVLGPTCLEADALATACFVLGPEEGMKLIERLDGVEGLLVSQGKVVMKTYLSEGLKKFIFHLTKLEL